MFSKIQSHDIESRMAEYAASLEVGIRFAFQAIVDAERQEVVGCEALVRGVSGQSAEAIIARIRPENQFHFDQACRIGAIQAARTLGADTDLHINCSRVTPENMAHVTQVTRYMADEYEVDARRIVLEFGNLEQLGNPRELAGVATAAREAGFRVLADNFGVNEAGLKRLVVFAPDFVKLDRQLVSGVHLGRRRQAIVKGVLATANAMEIGVIATGVERQQELDWLRAAGVARFQGYFFGRPSAEQQPEIGRVEEVAPTFDPVFAAAAG